MSTGGNAGKSPSRGLVAQWVSKAWNAVPNDLIKKAFEVTGIKMNGQPATEVQWVEEVIEEGHVDDIFTTPPGYAVFEDDMPTGIVNLHPELPLQETEEDENCTHTGSHQMDSIGVQRGWN